MLAVTLLATSVTADEYSDAYKCGYESFEEGYGGGPVAFCIGNSYDPSPLEMRAFTDAERDFKARKKDIIAPCSFGFGVWVANGSRSDGFEEGAQALNSLESVADLLAVERDVFIYDNDGNRLAAEVVQRWFVRQGGNVVLTNEAKKQCPDKINNK